MKKFFSPAKINLFLQITEKRSDGYHNLASLFQAISLYDILTFSFSEKDNLISNVTDIPNDQSNLIWKAVHLFRKKTGLHIPLNIILDKQIPKEAGLGGGSSNAATTLWALNELHNFPATLTDLIEWSSEIGSDITFFLSNGTAFCTGRGEIIENLAPLKAKNVWVYKPSIGLSTPKVFKELILQNLPKRDVKQALYSFYEASGTYFNDLEQAAFSIEPKLEEDKNRLLAQGFDTVLMTGSGSAFFCIGTPNQNDKELIPVHFVNRAMAGWYNC